MDTPSSFSNLCPCLFCGSLEARWTLTKKYAPCVSCRACNTRCFLNSPRALASLEKVAPQVAQVIARVWSAGLAQQDQARAARLAETLGIAATGTAP